MNDALTPGFLTNKGTVAPKDWEWMYEKDLLRDNTLMKQFPSVFLSENA